VIVAYDSFMPSGMPKKKGARIHAYESGNYTLCGILLTADYWLCDGFPRESVNCSKCKQFMGRGIG